MHVVGFVCTTNRTLSPMASLVVGARLARDGHGWLAEVASFGVDVPPGARLAEQAEVVLAMHGYPTAHTPAELTLEFAKRSTLLVTLTDQAHDAVLRMRAARSIQLLAMPEPTEYDDFAEALVRIEDATPDLVDWMERTHWWT